MKEKDGEKERERERKREEGRRERESAVGKAFNIEYGNTDFEKGIIETVTSTRS